MKERLKFIGSLLAFVLILASLSTVYVKFINIDPKKSVSFEELNSVPSLTAKDTPVTVYNVKLDVITINSTGGLKEADYQSATSALENTIITVCKTGLYDVVVTDYLVDGKLLSNSSFKCDEFLAQYSQEV